jgi:hypothetical protein
VIIEAFYPPKKKKIQVPATYENAWHPRNLEILKYSEKNFNS